MKQVELAKELGISKSYLSMILSGQRSGNPKIMKTIRSQKFVNFEAESSLRGRCPRPLDECASHRTTVKCSPKFITSGL
ncbi:helix-turn-helix domain-containing protein [Chloroflexota bacterium]